MCGRGLHTTGESKERTAGRSSAYSTTWAETKYWTGEGGMHSCLQVLLTLTRSGLPEPFTRGRITAAPFCWRLWWVGEPGFTSTLPLFHGVQLTSAQGQVPPSWARFAVRVGLRLGFTRESCFWQPCFCRLHNAAASSPYICQQVKASDASLLSGYLYMTCDKKVWQKRYFAVHDNFTLYAFKAHQVGTLYYTTSRCCWCRVTVGEPQNYGCSSMGWTEVDFSSSTKSRYTCVQSGSYSSNKYALLSYSCRICCGRVVKCQRNSLCCNTNLWWINSVS